MSFDLRNFYKRVPILSGGDARKPIGRAEIDENGQVLMHILDPEWSYLLANENIWALNLGATVRGRLRHTPTFFQQMGQKDRPMENPPETSEPIHARAITNEERACSYVRQTVLEHLDKSDPVPEFDVYVVWYCYILGNWKAMVSTSLPDGKYYEVTFDRVKNAVYVDSYVKFDNQRHPQPYEV